ncbi:MAG: ribose 5-phosphate isomerase B [Eubacteriales bacterium]|nr:ribose 5-phosphate isomerase B [Eubacteriales bacterium]
MKIAIGNDHSAVELKNEILAHLESRGFEVLNVGTDTSDSVDYPLYGEKVAKAVVNKEADLGIAICGTGVGISIACNKVKGIRACCCSEPYSAKLSRMHNNSNVLCFGARVVGSELAKMIVDSWLDAAFEGDRHQRRVNQLGELEERF